jgi:hypothetical protein
MMMTRPRISLSQPGKATRVLLLLLVTGCASGARDGLDVAKLPVEVRDDYALFARRCSKCHPLARPLNSGIDDDSRWIDYVSRMRRQPGSGITQQDTAPILRFLHYYSLEQKRVKRSRAMANGAAPPPAASPSPPPRAPDPSVTAPAEASDR